MDHSRPTLMYSTRQPKVTQLDLAPLGEEHVCRLEVSVQHLQVKQRLGRLQLLAGAAAWLFADSCEWFDFRLGRRREVAVQHTHVQSGGTAARPASGGKSTARAAPAHSSSAAAERLARCAWEWLGCVS